MDPRQPDGSDSASIEESPQTRSAILDERTERHNLSTLHIEQARLEALFGRDSQTFDLVLPGRQGLDRTLPARLRMSLAEEAIGSEIVDRDRNHEPVGDLARSLSLALPDVVRQHCLPHISARGEQLAGRAERF